ncbi:MAG: glycosyltransferase family 2 protein [Bdellovibrionaceae bacterium]|nr:glycosyltransferase family 2 protein [Pseudobdellovibrionaceae bacterium]
MSKIAIVIPTYNPSALLMKTLADLNDDPCIAGMNKVVVNDGSTNGLNFLQQVASDQSFFLIQLKTNRGKGAAIKEAIRYILSQGWPVEFLVTVDSDGQHLAKDVSRVIESASQNTTAIHVGSRRLEKDKTPWRSFFGNFFSRMLFSCLYGSELKDTQSGLRAYPKHFFPTLLSLQSDRYDFEMEAIIRAMQSKVCIAETQIDTVYLMQNKSSHFRPFLDSYRVLRVMAKTRFKHSASARHKA